MNEFQFFAGLAEQAKRDWRYVRGEGFQVDGLYPTDVVFGANPDAREDMLDHVRDGLIAAERGSSALHFHARLRRRMADVLRIG